MADYKKVSCPRCNQKYRLAIALENRKVVCRQCESTFVVVGEAAQHPIGAATDGAGSESSAGGGMFDSLNVDDLLNSTNAGSISPPLPSKPCAPPAPTVSSAFESQEHAQSATRTSNDPIVNHHKVPSDRSDNRPQRNPKKSADRKKNLSQPNPAPPATDVRAQSQSGTPVVPAHELQTALDEQQAKQNRAADERDKHAESGRSDQRVASDAIDPEEQAVFEYVKRVNKRKNMIAALSACIFAVLLGWYFIGDEIEKLRKPLTAEEREFLEEQGFRLEAVKNAPRNQFALPHGVDAVTVAPGARLAWEKPAAPKNLENAQQPFDPNVGLNRVVKDRRRRPNRARVNGRPPVEIDTNNNQPPADPTAFFAISTRVPTGNVLAISPRNHIFYTDQHGIVSYDLKSKKNKSFRSIAARTSVTALAVSMDGKWLAVGLKSGGVDLFQLDAEGRFFKAQANPLTQTALGEINKIAFAPDFSSVAAIDSKNALCAWRLNGGAIISKLTPDKPVRGKCLDLKYHATSDGVFAAFSNGQLSYDLNGSVNHTDNNQDGLLKSAALGVESRITVGCNGSTLEAWAWDRSKPLWRKTIRSTSVQRITLSPNERTVLFDDGGKSVIELNVQTGELVGRHAGDGRNLSRVSASVISPDGQFLVASSDRFGNQTKRSSLKVNRLGRPDTRGVLFALEEFAPPIPDRIAPEKVPVNNGRLATITLDQPTKQISSLAMSADGLLFVGDKNGIVSSYDWTHQSLLDQVKDAHGRSVTALAVCGDWLLAGLDHGGILVYEIEANGLLSLFDRYTVHDSEIFAIKPIPESDGSPTKRAVSVSRRGNLRVREIPTKGLLLNSTPLANQPPEGIAVTDSGSILIATRSQLARVNLSTHKEEVMQSDVTGTRVSVSQHGKNIALNRGNMIIVANAKTGSVRSSFQVAANVGQFMFAPDSKRLYVGFPDHVAVINYRSGKTIEKLDLRLTTLSGIEQLFSIAGNNQQMAAVNLQGAVVVLPIK